MNERERKYHDELHTGVVDPSNYESKPAWNPADAFKPDRAKSPEELTVEVTRNMLRAEEVKLETEKVKQGIDSPAHVYFEVRTPANILDRPIPEPFAEGDVPPELWYVAKSISNATGFDHNGLVVAGVASAAAMIDDRYQLLVDERKGWKVRACAWALLLGNSATGKSPAIDKMAAPVKLEHLKLVADWERRMREKAEGERAPPPALFTSNTTIEALQQQLIANERGIVVIASEVTSWLGRQEGKGGDTSERGEWLDARDGGPRQIGRIGRGQQLLRNWSVSLIAGATPEGLRDALKYRPDDGLLQRMEVTLLAPMNLEAQGDGREAEKYWDELLQRIYINTTRGHFDTFVRFSPEAQALFDTEVKHLRWLAQNCAELLPAFASHLSKFPGMLAEKALVFHCLQGRHTTSAIGTLGQYSVIQSDTMWFAVNYMRRMRQHANGFHNHILGHAPAFELARALARSLVAEETLPLSIGRDWMTQHCSDFRKGDDLLRRAAVQVLEDYHWLNAMGRQYGGWPRQWKVHPHLTTLYGPHGQVLRARREAVKQAIGLG